MPEPSPPQNIGLCSPAYAPAPRAPCWFRSRAPTANSACSGPGVARGWLHRCPLALSEPELQPNLRAYQRTRHPHTQLRKSTQMPIEVVRRARRSSTSPTSPSDVHTLLSLGSYNAPRTETEFHMQEAVGPAGTVRHQHVLDLFSKSSGDCTNDPTTPVPRLPPRSVVQRNSHLPHAV